MIFESVDVLYYLFGRSEKDLGIFYVLFERLERGGVLEAVAGTLVGNDLKVNYLFRGDVSVSVKLVYLSLCAVRDKYGEISKIVEMVVYRLDAERAHAGDDHRAPEGKVFGKDLRAKSNVVKRFYYGDDCLEKTAREFSKEACYSVGFVFSGGCAYDLLVKSFVDVEHGVAGVKITLIEVSGDSRLKDFLTTMSTSILWRAKIRCPLTKRLR